MFQAIGSFFTFLFDTAPFPARWHCGNWTPALGWTHILSDLAIGGAYMAIPALIFYFVRQRPDLPFPKILYLFGMFIVMCGATHFVEAVIFWQPVYNFSAFMKIGTAIVSWVTVWSIIPVIPLALRYPGLEDMNKRLQAANEELEDFAQIVSHDLRAPLRGVRRLSEWLTESLKDADEETRDNLREIQARTDKMNHLIERVLAYSRAGTGLRDTDQVDSRAVLEEVLRSFATEQQQRVELRGDFPVLAADEIHLMQVFQNLLENAFRYLPAEEGLVVVSVERSERFYTFAVADNGQGVPEPMREKLFSIFHSGEPASSLHAGLGLSIARRVVERNHGKIWLESPTAGGSCFKFTWPVKRK